MKYHYKLNFKKSIDIEDSDDQDIGYIISGAIGKRYLYKAIYLTNAIFSDARTAKNYLCLTYSPRFRYIFNVDEKYNIKYKTDRDESNIIKPNHIKSKDGIVISKRTSPAFGKIGGAGEWIIPITNIFKDFKKSPKNKVKITLKVDHYYKNGGETERWYMADWDRELIAKIFSGYTGRLINSDDLKEAIKKGINIEDKKSLIDKEDIKTTFWQEGIPSVLISKPDGVVAYSPIIFKEIKEKALQRLAYLSVSCSFQELNDIIYIKFWGAIWEDYFLRNGHLKCDKISYNIKTELNKRNLPLCVHNEEIEYFKDIATQSSACGIRFCSYLIESEEISLPKNFKINKTKKKFIKTISQFVTSIKNYLLDSYKNECLYRLSNQNIHLTFCKPWCFEYKNFVILPNLEDDIKI